MAAASFTHEALEPGEAMEEEVAVRPGDTYLCQRKDGTYHDAEVVKVRKNKRSGQEEYFVHYVGLTRRQAEWVGKTRLFLSKPMKADGEENSAAQKFVDHEKMTWDQSHEEEEPEPKKVKTDTSLVCKVEYMCLLCSKRCEDPIQLECSHGFCRSCINKARANQDPLLCPECQKVVIIKSTTSLALADIPETLVDTAIPKCPGKMGDLQHVTCSEHDEKLNLYCTDDGALACIICRDSLKHKDHNFLPVVDAVDVYQAELSTIVSPLEEVWKKTAELTNQQSEKIQQHLNAMSEYRQHIMSEFGNLYNMLKEQKEKLLKQLHEQSRGLHEEMENNAAKIRETEDVLKETLAIANQRVNESDPASFLGGINEFISKCREQLEVVDLNGNKVTKKELCRATFKGPIQYTAWKQMKPAVPVTLRHAKWLPKKQLVLPEPVKDDNTESGRSEVEEAEVKVIPALLKDVKPQPLLTCPEHEEKLHLYCTDDGSLICIICRDSLKHNGHKFLPIKDAVEVYGTELSTVVTPLEDTWKKKNELTIQQSQKIEQLQNTMMEAWQSITSEFGSLHKFLKEQKEKLLEQLKEEGESLRKVLGTNAARMEEERDAIKETLAIANQKMEEPDSASFLHGINELTRRCQEQQEAFKSPSSPITEKPLCQGTFRGPIQYIAWRQMKSLFPKNDIEDVQLPMPAEEMNSEKKAAKSPVPKNSEPIQKPIPMECENSAQATVSNSLVKTNSSETKEIWIAGDDFLTVVKTRAQEGHLGLNLGFGKEICTVHWFVSSNDCFGLLSSQTSLNQRTPDIICLCLDRYAEYSDHFALINNLNTVERLFPTTTYLLSMPLPKAPSRPSSLKDIEVKVNCMFGQFAKSPRYHVLKHEALKMQLNRRYKAGDHVYYTNDEIDLFLKDIKNALWKKIIKDCKASVKVSFERSFGNIPGRGVESEGAGDQPSAKIEMSYVTKPKDIWILGDDFISAARLRAETSSLGLNLEFEEQTCTVHWWMVNSWIGLTDKVQRLLRKRTVPKVMFLHFGSEDVGEKALMKVVRLCLKILPDCYPNTQFILSSVLPKPEWYGTPVEHWRKVFNFFLIKHTEKSHFLLLQHEELEKTLLERHKEGGHGYLTFAENDLFLTSIRDALRKVMFQDSPAVASVKEIPIAEEDSSSAAVRPRRPPSGERVAPADTKRRQIWIMGNSYIYRASEHAAHMVYGRSLGFDEKRWEVHWMTKTMWRNDLLTHMQNESKQLGRPSIVYLHTGSHDLAVDSHMLLGNFMYDIERLGRVFTRTRFIFSAILPRAEWSDHQEAQRQEFNKGVRKYAKEQGFRMDGNSRLTDALLQRFKSGQRYSSLTEKENGMFLETIRDSIHSAMLKFLVPVDKRPKRQKGAPSTVHTRVKSGPDEAAFIKKDQKSEEAKTSDADPAAAIKEDGDTGVEDKRTLGTGNAAAIKEDEKADAERKKALERRQIWILGNSYIYRASVHAAHNVYGKTLGFDEDQWEVHWMPNIIWRNTLLKEMQKATKQLGNPSIVFLHTGSNDLGKASHMLHKNFMHDIDQLVKLFPRTRFIFSEILPRSEWEKHQEAQRKMFNSEVGKYAKEHGFRVLSNRKLSSTLFQRFKTGQRDSNLTEVENEIFLKIMRSFIQSAMVACLKRVVKKPKQRKEDLRTEELRTEDRFTEDLFTEGLFTVDTLIDPDPNEAASIKKVEEAGKEKTLGNPFPCGLVVKP